jgi:cytochrome c-type biogenesis protein CcsB
MDAFETWLLNLSFLALRIHALFRWIRPSVFQPFATGSVEGAGWAKVDFGRGLSTTILLASRLRLRWWQTNHFAISNLFESLIFLSWLLTAGLLLLQRQNAPTWLLAVLGLCPLLVLAFASFILPESLRRAGPLVPALKSNWLLRHVSVRVVSYAGLRRGSLLALVYTSVSLASPDRRSILQVLDQWSYRCIGIGFPFLTLGILSGAVWAESAWGSYWSWDPKETASLILWLLYAAYLHVRLRKGEQGQFPARLASIGFVGIWICYLGVNLLGKGLHSYGFFG